MPDVAPSYRRRAAPIALAAILLVSLSLNVAGSDWGLPYLWHPDEKVANAVRMIHAETLNPGYFVNPSLHVYLVWSVVKLAYTLHPGRVVQLLLHRIVPLTDPTHPDRALQFLATRLARGLSALFATATVWLLYVLGRRHGDELTGLLAGALGAVTMAMVNFAHFATPESLLALLTLSVLATCDPIVVRARWQDYLWAGALVGLACSTKYTAWLLALPFLVAHLAGRGVRAGLSARGLGWLVAGGATAVAVFCLTTPYALLDWRAFAAALGFNWSTTGPSVGLGSGPADPSWLPNLAHLVNGLGWPLFCLAAVAWLVAIPRVLRGRGDPAAVRAYRVHAVWIGTFFVFYGLSPVNALRYLVPIVPSLVLLAALLLGSAVRAARGRATWSRLGVAGLAAGVLAYSLVYAIRADFVFLHDTRYGAGRWLTQQRLGAPLHYFSFEAYVPFFEQPTFRAVRIPTLSDLSLEGNDFWLWGLDYLEGSSNAIVDPDFYRRRFFDRPLGFAERAQFYQLLMDGSSAGGYREVARFEVEASSWLDPRPEFVAPQILAFAKPTTLMAARPGRAP